MTTSIVVFFALLLDYCIAEPRRAHPLVGFGKACNWIEQRLHGSVPDGTPIRVFSQRIRGALALLLLTLPLCLLTSLLSGLEHWGITFELILLYLCIGRQSLADHALAIRHPLSHGDLDEARRRTGFIVSRNTGQMTTTEISKATVESVLENGNDALFGTLFWYLIAGLPGALLHRLVNTLDAMWGYKTDHYLHFGWAAARLDDLLNWIPARLCALTYALLGQRKQALACWRRQAKSYESPNGGPVMAAGAGALGIRLGGPAIYHGKLKVKPFLGVGPEATPQDIDRAVRLLNGGALLWLVLIISVNLVVIA